MSPTSLSPTIVILKPTHQEFEIQTKLYDTPSVTYFESIVQTALQNNYNNMLKTAVSKKIIAKSRENLEINRLEDELNKKKKNDEELARQRFEEQKKRHEQQAERLRKAKSERQGNVRFYVSTQNSMIHKL